MDFLQPFIDLYKNHQTLAIALLSLVGGALLTKFIPALYAVIVKLLSKLGGKIGGRLAYKNIQNKYLDWVVFQNQDLNLTGIIGSGQKPRLEQVFISLKVLEKSDQDDRKEDVEVESTRLTIVSRIWSNTWSNAQKWMKGFFNHMLPPKEKPRLAFFQSRRFWKARLVLKRDGMRTILILFIVTVLLLILPSYSLLTATNVGGFIGGISAFALSLLPTTMIVLILQGERFNLKDLGDWIGTVIFVGLPTVIIIYIITSKVVVERQSPWAIIIGTTIAFAFVYARRDRLGTKQYSEISGERAIKEIGTLISSHDNVAILGKPGSGKSTFVQFIALTFAQAKAGKRGSRKPGIVKKRFGMRQWYLPIFIPLRKVAHFISDESNTHLDKNLFFEAFRQEVLPSLVRNDFSEAYLRHMLKKKKCLFLLDGLDEVANDEEFRVVVNEIKGLVSQFPGNKFIVTSRHSGWRGGLGSAFPEVEVNDLDDDQITTFIDSWYQAIEQNRASTLSRGEALQEKPFREQRAKDKAGQLKEALNSVENIRNLAKNPLLLSMICYVHYNKTLPKERLSLYEDCSKLLLEQWDLEKGLPQDDIPLNLARKEILMQEIAFALHSGKIGSSSEQKKEITSKEIIPIIKSTLERFKVDPSQAEILFQKLVSRTGVIIAAERYKDLYTFSHLTFQEFYTARYLQQNQINIFLAIEQSSYENSKNLIGWWREVILLYSNTQKDISEIIQQLCEVKKEDLLRQNLRIAAQCFGEAVEVPNPNLEIQLFAQLINIRCYGNSPQIAHALQPQVKHYLLNFANRDDFYRDALLTAIHKVQQTDEAIEIAHLLLEMTQSVDSNIQNAALDALAKLWQTQDVPEFADQETIIQLLDCKHPQITLIIMSGSATLNRVIHTTV